jgi:hypothetical protein
MSLTITCGFEPTSPDQQANTQYTQMANEPRASEASKNHSKGMSIVALSDNLYCVATKFILCSPQMMFCDTGGHPVVQLIFRCVRSRELSKFENG